MIAIQWRGPVPASNHAVGRGGHSVELIVDHWTVVMFEGAIRRFKDPASILSAQYVIGSDGRIAQLVSEEDTAYHAGVFSVNQRSIGIEHEAGPGMPPSDARIVREALEEDDMFTDADRAMLKRVYDHLEAYEPLTWTKRLQLWLAKAVGTGLPTADLSGPDVETGQPFDAKTASRR